MSRSPSLVPRTVVALTAALAVVAIAAGCGRSKLPRPRRRTSPKPTEVAATRRRASATCPRRWRSRAASAAKPRADVAEAAGHARTGAGRHRRPRPSGQTVADAGRARDRRAGRRGRRRGRRREGVARARPRRRSPTRCSSYERAKNLFESGALPRQRLDAAETAQRAAEAQRDLAQANLAQADASLRRAREVRRDATLTLAGHRRRRRAQLRRRRLVAPATKPVVVVADTRQYEARGRRVGARGRPPARRHAGAGVGPGRPGEVFDGRLAAIAPEVDERNRHFRIEVRVPNADARAAVGHVRDGAIDRDTRRASGRDVPRDAVGHARRPARRPAHGRRRQVHAGAGHRRARPTATRVQIVDGPGGRRHDRRRRAAGRSHRPASTRPRRLQSISGARSRGRQLSRLQQSVIMWISNTSIKRPVFATMVIVSFMVLGHRVDDAAGHRPVPRRQLPLRERHGGLSRRGAGRSRDAGHQADRGRGRRHQRRQARRVATRPSRSRASASSCASRSIAQAGRRGSAREGRGDPRPAAQGDRGSDDPALRRRGAADHGVRGRLVAAVRRHAPAGRRRPQAAASSRSTASPRSRSTAARCARSRSTSIRGRLEALGLPVSVVADKLAAENLDVPGRQGRPRRPEHLAAHEGRVPDRRGDRERHPPLRRRIDRAREGRRHGRRRLRGARRRRRA